MTPEELDTHADTIRDSIYADDRQTQLQIGHGLASLRAMTQEIERLQVAFDGIVKLHDVNLRELEQLKRELAEKECTCGSGAHPRRCLRHPQGFDLHVAQLNYEVAQDTIQELEKELEQAERELAEKSEQLRAVLEIQSKNYLRKELEKEVIAKEAELTRLREALTDAEDFARHDRGCPDYSDEGPCACGYERWWTRKEAALHPSPSKPEVK